MPSDGTPINRTMGAAEWAMLLTLSVLWGGSFFFVGVALAELPPFSIVLLRVGLAALILNAVVRIFAGGMPRVWGIWRAFFAMGLLNNAIPFCLIVWGQTQVASGLAAILNATTPFFAVLLAHFLTADEKLAANRIVGVLIGLAGVVAIVGPEALTGLGSDLLAQLAILGAGISYACAGIYGRRFRALGVAPLATATGQVTASSLLLLPVVLLVDEPWTLAMPGLQTWLAIVGIAALSTALAYVLYFRILATAGATNLLLVTLLVPVSAIVLGALILGETLDITHVVGMALIALGLISIDGRLFARLRAS